jgi:hypothetical protein
MVHPPSGQLMNLIVDEVGMLMRLIVSIYPLHRVYVVRMQVLACLLA